MNAYEAARRMYIISEELTKLSDKLSVTIQPSTREAIEKNINNLEVEFFEIKHKLERIKL